MIHVLFVEEHNMYIIQGKEHDVRKFCQDTMLPYKRKTTFNYTSVGFQAHIRL